MAISDLLNYYSGLIIVQYRTKEKIIKTVQLLVNQAVVDDLATTEQNCFDLNTAIGEQLDILARIVGVNRQLYGVDLGKTYFNFTRYDDTPHSVGFGRYDDDPYQYEIRRYLVGTNYTLTDTDLRTLIKLKIIFNNTYSSFKYLKEALYLTFNGEIDILTPETANHASGLTFFNFTRYDGEPASVGFSRYFEPDDYHFYRYANFDVMTINYLVEQQHHTAFEGARFLNVVPRPMAVMLEVEYV